MIRGDGVSDAETESRQDRPLSVVRAEMPHPYLSTAGLDILTSMYDGRCSLISDVMGGPPPPHAHAHSHAPRPREERPGAVKGHLAKSFKYVRHVGEPLRSSLL